jgi:hypothetical protein
MPLDPVIAQGFRGLQLQDPLELYGRVNQLQQLQQQNQLSALKMQEYQREVEQQNKLRDFIPTLTPENRGQLLSYGVPGRQAYETLLKGERDTREAEKTAADIAAARMKQARDLLPSVTTPEAYANWRNYTLQSLPRLATLIPEQYSPETVRGLMMEADKALEQHFVSQDLGDVTRVVSMPKYGPGAARVVQGTEAQKMMAPGEAQRLEVSLQQLQNDAARIKLEGQRLGLEGRRVAVAEANAQRDADPAFQQRIEAARTVGRKAAEGDVAAVQALPRVISRAEEGVRLIDELIGKRDDKGQLLKGSRPHPGFQNAVGATWLPGIRFVPGTDAASFMSRFDQIKGASFLEAFESLKGGGAITEKEGAKATDAINRMSISTDEEEFIRAALDLQDVIRKGVANAQSRAGRAGATAPAAAPGARPSLDSIFK